jgi:hypothetical protein
VGTGRIAVPIAQSGIEVIGVDSSAGMLDVAREYAARRASRSTCASATCASRRSRAFPLVIVAFRSLLHMESDADRRAALRACAGCSSRAAGSSSTSSRPAPTTSARRTAAGSSASRDLERADWDEDERRSCSACAAAAAETSLSLAWVSVTEWRVDAARRGFTVEGALRLVRPPPWRGPRTRSGSAACGDRQRGSTASPTRARPGCSISK